MFRLTFLLVATCMATIIDPGFIQIPCSCQEASWGLFRRYWSWSCWPNDGCAVREHVWTLMLVMLQLLRLVPLLSCLSRLMRVLCY